MRALLCLCSILFFICTVSFPFTVAQESTAVLDTNGDELKVGTKYYVVSATPGAADGGIGLAKYANANCAITVAQEHYADGLTCTFHPANSAESTIHLSKSLNVKFDTPVPCADSTVWKVGDADPTTGLPLIQIGGVLGNPKCETVGNWFKIEKASSQGNYKFLFDPNDVCNNPQPSYNLTIAFAIDQRPMLRSNDSQFEAKFIKYECANGNKAYVQ